jgi:KaiC/GvpD/RAD55 family RecA-like ATPase
VSALLRLPPELVEFSLRDPPRSLLIRGEPGVGKSTLGLTLLSSFRGKRILVTSRVTKGEIEKDYPWLLSGVEGPVEVIESFSSPSRIEAKGRVLHASPGLVDAPPGDPQLEQLWLPDSLIDAFSRIGPGHPGMVVIDSWDALVEHYVGAAKPAGIAYPDREEIERLMLGLLGRGRAHLVLIVEREDPTQLDYLVDGVVSCVATSHEDRLERWTHLKKMRGVRVSHPSYPYTLEGGRFLCIAPMAPEFHTRLPQPQPEPDARAGWLWPGSSDYATHFGRLQFGRATLIEVERGVPAEAVRLLVSPFHSQVLSQGGRILVVLPPSLSVGDVWQSFRAVVTPDQFLNSVRVYAPSGPRPSDPDPELLEKVMVSGPVAGGPSMTTRMPEANRFLREGGASGLPSLGVVWINGLRAGASDESSAYSPETLAAVVQKTLSGALVHLAMIGAPSDPLVSGLEEIASTRITMRSRSGRVFVYGDQPLTPPLVLTQSDNGSPYHLIRVV